MPKVTAPLKDRGRSTPGLLALNPVLIPESHSLMILIDRGIHDDSLMYFQNFNFVNIKIENSVRSGTTVGGERWKLVGGGLYVRVAPSFLNPLLKLLPSCCSCLLA